MPAPPPRTPLPPLSLDDRDESVRIAVRALGDMRNSRGLASPLSTAAQPTPALSVASSSSSPVVGTPALPPDGAEPPDYLARMSTLPIVNTALRAYEHGKASSRVVKYGAEMMESTVSTISRPVIDRLGIRGRRASSRDSTALDLDARGRLRSPSTDRGRGEAWASGLQFREASAARSTTSSAFERDREASVERDDERMGQPASPSRTPTPQTQTQEVAQRSRWQTVLLEAGGISAAVSEDSMRRLKYCLNWLQYATARIDAQILVLRDFIASVQGADGHTHARLVSAAHMRTLHDVKRDIIDTIRQAVDVVSKSAGGALPEPARATVRAFILHLPQRWARAAAATGTGAQHRAGPVPLAPREAHEVGHASASGSTPSAEGAPAPAATARRRGQQTPYSRPASPASTAPSSPRLPRTPLSPHGHGRGALAGLGAVPPPTAGAAAQAAQRILTLATESLDMMRGVTGVVKESLDRAETWVERLRAVGLQRQATHDPETEGAFSPTDTDARGHEHEHEHERNRARSRSPSSTPSPPPEPHTPRAFEHQDAEDAYAGAGARRKHSLGDGGASASFGAMSLSLGRRASVPMTGYGHAYGVGEGAGAGAGVGAGAGGDTPRTRRVGLPPVAELVRGAAAGEEESRAEEGVVKMEVDG